MSWGAHLRGSGSDFAWAAGRGGREGPEAPKCAPVHRGEARARGGWGALGGREGVLHLRVLSPLYVPLFSSRCFATNSFGDFLGEFP